MGRCELLKPVLDFLKVLNFITNTSSHKISRLSFETEFVGFHFHGIEHSEGKEGVKVGR
jgi:hypothetical protein